VNVDLPSCIAGSKRAWDDFVRASAPVIYAAVRRALRSRHIDAAQTSDRVQDVYVRLLREDCKLLRTFNPSRASLVTWLTLIARTVVHEHARRRTLSTLPIDGREPAAPADNPHAADAPSHESTSPLSQFPLQLLSEQQRQVIEMLFQQGLSVEAAAARLGVEQQTIRSAKHKALTRLREALKAHLESPEDAESGGYRRPPPATTTRKNDDAAR
jgi:RNA polymerase sigma factor (sigma-70 family)